MKLHWLFRGSIMVIVRRFLYRLLPVVMFFAVLPGQAEAGTKYYTTQAEANAGCLAHLATRAAIWPSAPWECRDDSPGSKRYFCHGGVGYVCTDQVHQWSVGCDVEPDQAFAVSGVLGDGGLGPPPDGCSNGCLMTSSFSDYVPSSQGGGCYSEDTNNDGVHADGDSYECAYDYSATGALCEGAAALSPVGGTPVPEFDCTNVDCSSPPSDPAPPPNDGGGPGSGNPFDSGGDDSDDTGGNNGAGDGDPDTPGAGDGTGDGDTDGDGTRDVDCNPLSNPDCAYAGQGSASSVCGVAPSCSGDPVQCAILFQNYNTMCAILTAAENERKDEEAQNAQASNNCTTAPVCDGDPVQCTIIRQLWENQCGLIDTSKETPLSDDPDYGRDLAGVGEGTEVDLSTGLDEAGFATGTCPAPIAIDAKWAQITFDTAPLCSVAAWVRVFVILFTLLWAAPYVVRSF